jgi:hypothetical protein
MTKIPRGDKARMAMAPMHVAIGGSLVWRWLDGARTPMVLVLGLLFVAFGIYRLTLITRALKDRR